MEAKIQALKEGVAHLIRQDIFHLGPVTISSTVINTWIVMAILFVVVWLLTRGGFREQPKGRQAFLEVVIEFIHGLMDELMGKEGRRHLWIVGSLLIFILFLNLSWFIPGMLPPTTDIMTTAGLAITAIFLVQVVSISTNGFGGYVKRFSEPFVLLAPMNVIEEAVKPFSLAIRLFGNMFGEKMVVTILFALAPLVLPVPVMMLGILMGAIQAYIFTLLTISYLAAGMHGH